MNSLRGIGYAVLLLPFLSMQCFFSLTLLQPAVCGQADDLHTEITGMISDKSCNVAGDCRALALGNKACGGPSSYEVYSVLNVNQTLLDQKAAEQRGLAEQCNIELQIASTCSVVLEPAVDCVANLCAALP